MESIIRDMATLRFNGSIGKALYDWFDRLRLRAQKIGEIGLNTLGSTTLACCPRKISTYEMILPTSGGVDQREVVWILFF